MVWETLIGMLLLTQFTMLYAAYTGQQYNVKFQNQMILLVKTEQSFSLQIFGTYQLSDPIYWVDHI